MKVLSLFDGMSCGRVALDRIGAEVESYSASEIDKYAIQISKQNYPDIKHLGDIQELQGPGLKCRPDLVMGGSPCQSFSFAGRGRAFEDERGKLFWEFLRVLNEVQPKYFLLENVRMKQEHQDVISRELGVKPVLINSALVSAQNRNRLYWTNIPNISQPEDKKILLKDILECGCVDRDKSHCLDANYFKGGNLKQYYEKSRRQLVFNRCLRVGDADIKGHDSIKRVYSPEGKAPTLTTMQGGHREPKICCGAVRGRYKVDGIRQDHKHSVKGLTEQQLEIRLDQKTNTLTTVQKDNVVVGIYEDVVEFNDNQQQKIESIQTNADKSNCVTTAFGRGGSSSEYLTSVKKKTLALGDTKYWRKLTPLECERLQTLPDNYTQGVSNTQRYKMIGNGWTVDVIAHILKPLVQPSFI
jgi:DNA-cytosine methyltransferase